MQETLERALGEIRRGPTRLTVAGRTDAGVHARGQVASHPGDPAPAEALNALLPPDVRVVASEPAPDGFDARRDARSRSYAYRIFTRRSASAFERGRALHWPRPVDVAALDACAAVLPGHHDFRAFTPTQTDHVRFQRHVIGAAWRRSGEHVLELRIEADAFMRHMVRTLVGTMLAVAGGPLELERFERLLAGAGREQAGETAPAHGLYLESVSY